MHNYRHALRHKSIGMRQIKRLIMDLMNNSALNFRFWGISMYGIPEAGKGSYW